MSQTHERAHENLVAWANSETSVSIEIGQLCDPDLELLVQTISAYEAQVTLATLKTVIETNIGAAIFATIPAFTKVGQYGLRRFLHHELHQPLSRNVLEKLIEANGSEQTYKRFIQLLEGRLNRK